MWCGRNSIKTYKTELEEYTKLALMACFSILLVEGGCWQEGGIVEWNVLLGFMHSNILHPNPDHARNQIKANSYNPCHIPPPHTPCELRDILL